MWTRFMDMCSGGGQKEAFAYCYIEAPKDEAKQIFHNRFGHHPDRVTCTCCGEDYSVEVEGESLDEATEYERSSNPQQTLEEFRQRKDVLIIPKEDIKDSEREGSLPEQGYV